jgi:hypothetical protein
VETKLKQIFLRGGREEIREKSSNNVFLEVVLLKRPIPK